MESIFWVIGRLPALKWDDLGDLVKIFKGCNKYVLSRLSSCIFQYGLSLDDYTKLQRACNTKKNFDIV